MSTSIALLLSLRGGGMPEGGTTIERTGCSKLLSLFTGCCSLSILPLSKRQEQGGRGGERRRRTLAGEGRQEEASEPWERTVAAIHVL